MEVIDKDYHDSMRAGWLHELYEERRKSLMISNRIERYLENALEALRCESQDEFCQKCAIERIEDAVKTIHKIMKKHN